MTTATAIEKKKGCAVCGGIERGDTFVSLPDETGVARAVHIPIHAVDGKSTDRNVGCEEAFKSRVTAARKQELQQERETLALAAFRREGGNIPRLEQSSQRGFDGPVEDCSRFFDSENGRDLHLRRGHKVG